MIIGSTAIKHYFSEFREPKDLDIISPSLKISKEEQHYWIPEFENIQKYSKNPIYADPNLMLTIKSSHFGWDIHWEKTAYDILFLKSKGAKIIYPLYYTLFDGWIKVHGRKWATLKGKDSGTFFEDNVIRKYVHDDIHESIKTYDTPLYERLLDDGVMCSKDNFLQLSTEDRILLVKEEVWVTALERYLIPNDFKYSKKLAYAQSLKKLITTMSGAGYFKHWMIDNYEKLYNNTDLSYIDKFKQAEKNNQLRLVKDMERKTQLEKEIEELEQIILARKQELQVSEKAKDFDPTPKTLLALLKESDPNFENYFYSVGDSMDLGLGWSIECIHREGGSEGDGSDHYLILELKKDGSTHSLWQVPGYYSSYEGTDREWDNMFKVKRYLYEAVGYRPI